MIDITFKGNIISGDEWCSKKNFSILSKLRFAITGRLFIRFHAFSLFKTHTHFNSVPFEHTFSTSSGTQNLPPCGLHLLNFDILLTYI